MSERELAALEFIGHQLERQVEATNKVAARLEHLEVLGDRLETQAEKLGEIQDTLFNYLSAIANLLEQGDLG